MTDFDEFAHLFPTVVGGDADQETVAIELDGDVTIQTYRPQKVAQILGLPVQTILDWTKEGRTVCIRIGQEVFYPVEMVKDRSFLKQDEEFEDES